MSPSFLISTFLLIFSRSLSLQPNPSTDFIDVDLVCSGQRRERGLGLANSAIRMQHHQDVTNQLSTNKWQKYCLYFQLLFFCEGLKVCRKNFSGAINEPVHFDSSDMEPCNGQLIGCARQSKWHFCSRAEGKSSWQYDRIVPFVFLKWEPPV